MKKMKKLLSMLLTVIMVLAMAAPSFAADITVNGKGKSFSAYRLLNAKQQSSEAYEYELNETYAGILRTVLSLGENATEGEIIGAISAKSGNDVRTFANAVYDKVKDMTADATVTVTEENPEAVFRNVPQGYYLIVETAAEDASDAISLVMLYTNGQSGVTVTTKSESIPTPGKEVVETEKSAAVGDYVQYKLTAQLPADYDVYTEKYELTFIDTMSAGLTFVNEGEHQVQYGGTTLQGTVTTSTVETNKTELRVAFANTKLDTNLKAGDTITVTYWAQINSNAVTGANENSLKLEYSNNPYDSEQTGTTTPTPDVNVYTFALTVNKVDGNNAPLDGAKFTLTGLDSNTNTINKEIESTTQNPINIFNFTGLKAGKYKLEETNPPQGYNAVDPMYFEIIPTYTDAGNIDTLVIKALDKDGNVTDGESPITVSGEAVACTISTTVVNSTGAELPSTGGIGTTIFYAAGIILMAGAVFFVVRRKRA